MALSAGAGRGGSCSCVAGGAVAAAGSAVGFAWPSVCTRFAVGVGAIAESAGFEAVGAVSAGFEAVGAVSAGKAPGVVGVVGIRS